MSVLTNFTFPYFVTVACHRMRGVKVGKGTHICRGAYLDDHSPQLIEIGKGVGITQGVVIICHQRDLTNYKPGMYSLDCPFKLGRVVIKDGAHIGIGAIIGAHSVVTHDVPPYCVAVGSPAKVIRTFENKEQ